VLYRGPRKGSTRRYPKQINTGSESKERSRKLRFRRRVGNARGRKEKRPGNMERGVKPTETKMYKAKVKTGEECKQGERRAGGASEENRGQGNVEQTI